MTTLIIGPNGDLGHEDFERLVQIVADANQASGLADEQLQRIETTLDLTLMKVEAEN